MHDYQALRVGVNLLYQFVLADYGLFQLSTFAEICAFKRRKKKSRLFDKCGVVNGVCRRTSAASFPGDVGTWHHNAKLPGTLASDYLYHLL